MSAIELESDLLNYIVAQGFQPGDRLPSITDLQEKHMGISVSKIREQLEVARALGLVDVKLKTGTHLKKYDFAPAVRLSLFYALASDLRYFEQFSALRTHLEVAFWDEACQQLSDDDLAELRDCVDAAKAKLNGRVIRIPSEEHRTFHLTLFRRLDNPFVQGLLEVYWDAYEAVELNRYADLQYLRDVWNYHERILDAVCAGDFSAAKEAFIEHTKLLHYQPIMQAIEGQAEVTE